MIFLKVSNFSKDYMHEIPFSSEFLPKDSTGTVPADMASRGKPQSSFNVDWLWRTLSLCSDKLNEGIKTFIWMLFWCPSDPPKVMPEQNRPAPCNLNQPVSLLIKEKLMDGINFLVWAFFWCPTIPTDKTSPIKPYSDLNVNWLSELLFLCSKNLSEGIRSIVWVLFWCPSTLPNAMPEQNWSSPYDLKESQIQSLIPQKLMDGISFLVWVFFWCPTASVEKVSQRNASCTSSSDWLSERFPSKPSSLKLDKWTLIRLKLSCGELISKHFKKGELA